LKYVKETLLKIQKVNQNQGRGSSMAVKSGNSAEKKNNTKVHTSQKQTEIIIRINNNTRDKNAASTHFKQMCVVICEYVGVRSPRKDLSIRNSERGYRLIQS